MRELIEKRLREELKLGDKLINKINENFLVMERLPDSSMDYFVPKEKEFVISFECMREKGEAVLEKIKLHSKVIDPEKRLIRYLKNLQGKGKLKKGTYSGRVVDLNGIQIGRIVKIQSDFM